MTCAALGVLPDVLHDVPVPAWRWTEVVHLLVGDHGAIRCWPVEVPLVPRHALLHVVDELSSRVPVERDSLLLANIDERLVLRVVLFRCSPHVDPTDRATRKTDLRVGV